MPSLNLTFLKALDVTVISRAVLAEYTTFHLGGKCPVLIDCQTPLQVEKVAEHLMGQRIHFVLIGSGSNLLISDQGMECIVVRFSGCPIMKKEGDTIVVSGGTLLDDLVKFAMENSWEGLNYASGIPGTVGGAIVGNAGAFGRQVGDSLKSVTLFDGNGKKRTAKPENLNFSYRHSRLKETGDIVLEAVFELKPGHRQDLEKERQEILNVRKEKHPDLKTHPCAGSFFRNVEPTSKAERRQAAGYFLEQAGVKDFKAGGACIFEKHANIIVKGKDCTAQNVYDLSLKMGKAVFEKFGLTLVREVRLAGPFHDMPSSVHQVLW